VHINSVYMKR